MFSFRSRRGILMGSILCFATLEGALYCFARSDNHSAQATAIHDDKSALQEMQESMGTLREKILHLEATEHGVTSNGFGNLAFPLNFQGTKAVGVANSFKDWPGWNTEGKPGETERGEKTFGNPDFYPLIGARDAAAGFGVAIGAQTASPVVWMYDWKGRNQFDVRKVHFIDPKNPAANKNPANNSESVFHVDTEGNVFANGTVSTTHLITRGGDLAEQFAVLGAGSVKPAPGLLVAITGNQSGTLVVSSKPYDRTLAGIISGANGLQAGVILAGSGKEGLGEFPVALSGRAWCWCDAASGAIELGDPLTSSAIPGHAMKAEDHEKARGSSIGKAMTRLSAGTKGLVLVLVTLN